MKRLLQGTHGLVYSLGLCHLICDVAGCEYVSISKVPVSTDSEPLRSTLMGRLPDEDVDPW